MLEVLPSNIVVIFLEEYHSASIWFLPLPCHTPLLYSIYTGYITPLPMSKNNPLVHGVQLENFDMGFLGPNQVVLAWYKFVPRGVQLTQKLETLRLAE